MSSLILFDFDGTLADTAPDLAAAANAQRAKRGMAPLPVDVLRPVASQGARGMLRVALGMEPEHPEFNTARQQFLDHYAAHSTKHSRLFPGIAELLERISGQGHAWGIVTNKVTHLTRPIVEHFGLMPRCSTLVCGDTTPHAKPHPAPLLHAAQEAGYAVKRCLYVGDDLRDVQAARAAGMPVIAAAYGYLGDGGEVDSWHADARADDVAGLWPAIAGLLSK